MGEVLSNPFDVRVRYDTKLTADILLFLLVILEYGLES